MSHRDGSDKGEGLMKDRGKKTRTPTPSYMGCVEKVLGKEILGRGESAQKSEARICTRTKPPFFIDKLHFTRLREGKM